MHLAHAGGADVELVDAESARLLPGQRVVARFRLPSAPLGVQLWRAVRQTLQQRFQIVDQIVGGVIGNGDHHDSGELAGQVGHAGDAGGADGVDPHRPGPSTRRPPR